ncbi:hypothetical protein [Phenylobacterium sp.]|uniref:hypothetical protein n=1 Tax=Phenylobacterium sp. TaxID=1871053 RepID=UPI002E353EFC|nr:hypothetical protein [Phenylobacterium sp.]HEX2560224.1 hypothetical protein [Phenylobacterium sp.]
MSFVGRPLAIVLALLGPAAAASAEEQSTVNVYAGSASVSDGYEDRDYIGAYLAVFGDGVGFHADVSSVSREEDATFGAVGVSWDATESLRPQLMVGTSSDNFNILPEVFASAQLRYKPAGAEGWVITPRLTYRSYRSGGEEVQPAIDVVRYLPPADASGYWVLQGGAALSLNSSDENGYSVSGGVQTVRANGLTAGLAGEAGKMTYDSLLGIGVESDFWALRPSLGYRITPKHEIYLRGEIAETDFYDVQGLLLGLKLGL